MSLIFAGVLIGVLPTEVEAEIYSDTLRLHILAASDSEEDQELKLSVRDRILAEYSTRLSESEGIEESAALVEALLPEIEKTAEDFIAECGYQYTVTATLKEEWYDTRDYGSFSLPKGRYLSLVIRIGEGEGKNWWCVMYPPMCLDMALDAPSDDWTSDYSEGELSLVNNGRYRIKFKLLEMISDFID